MILIIFSDFIILPGYIDFEPKEVVSSIAYRMSVVPDSFGFLAWETDWHFASCSWRDPPTMLPALQPRRKIFKVLLQLEASNYMYFYTLCFIGGGGNGNASDSETPALPNVSMFCSNAFQLVP
jgi:hypothetical protein